MTDATLNSRGRPEVVVTGMGVLTSLGHGKEENWRKLLAGTSGIHRITRFPIAGLRTTIAGTVDFVTLDEPSAPALTEALGALAAEEALAEIRHRYPGRFPRPASARHATGRDGVAAAPHRRRLHWRRDR